MSAYFRCLFSERRLYTWEREEKSLEAYQNRSSSRRTLVINADIAKMLQGIAILLMMFHHLESNRIGGNCISVLGKYSAIETKSWVIIYRK